MNNKNWALTLTAGSKVFWRDPDNGVSSGIYRITSFNSGTGKVVDRETIIGLSNGRSEVEVTIGELSPVSLGLMADAANADLLAFARRAVAALDSPDNLSEDEKAQVIENGEQLIEAIEEAIRDREAIQVIVEGIEAATAVVNNWAQGDLAGAVNVLDGWVDKALETQSPDLDGLVATILMEGADSAKSVVACWESKHLAGAVTSLEVWLEDAVKDLADAGLLPIEEPAVVVEISGGNVSGVSALGDVRLLVVDYDNGEDNDDEPEIPNRGARASIADYHRPGEPEFVYRVMAVSDNQP